MNYSDGWYGGVYVATMYALAFVSEDIDYIINEALKVIPEQNSYYKCMKDVINWHKQYPDNWKMAWFKTQEKPFPSVHVVVTIRTVIPLVPLVFWLPCWAMKTFRHIGNKV